VVKLAESHDSEIVVVVVRITGAGWDCKRFELGAVPALGKNEVVQLS